VFISLYCSIHTHTVILSAGSLEFYRTTPRLRCIWATLLPTNLRHVNCCTSFKLLKHITSLQSDARHSHSALESRIIVVYIVALSAAVLGIRRFIATVSGKWLRLYLFSDVTPQAHEATIPPCGYLAQHGGPIILTFQVARFLANMGTMALAILAAIAVAGAHATLLSIVPLFKSITHSRRFATHSTITASSIFAVFVYRDVWPYATFTLVPADMPSPTVWIMLALSETAVAR
jgi:hypothetical protein